MNHSDAGNPVGIGDKDKRASFPAYFSANEWVLGERGPDGMLFVGIESANQTLDCTVQIQESPKGGRLRFRNSREPLQQGSCPSRMGTHAQQIEPLDMGWN